MQKLMSSVTLVFSASLLSVVGCSGGSGDESSQSASGADSNVGTSEASLASAPFHENETIVVQWNEAALDAIRRTGAGPTIAARALAEVHTAAYDAWSAYSKDALPTQPSVTRQPQNQRTDHNKTIAIDYASYRVLADLFPAREPALRQRLHELGGNAANMTTAPNTPEGIGNSAAAAIIAFRHADASNQLGDITPGAYSDYTGYSPVNTPTTVNDPNRWQPLHVSGVDQTFITPQWQNVIPFGLTDPTAYRPPPPPPFGSAAYEEQAEEMLELSAHLDDRRKVIAEYWTDGPGTAQAPGHWLRLAQLVSARDHHSIDDDAKLFFALGNAMLDASISIWESKRFYDSERPITAVHVLFGGKKVQAWAGPNKGTRTIDGATWQPYEPADEVTPASPEYAAEESAFAFAAAEVLEAFTGSGAFGGDYVADEGSSRIEGHTPRHDVRLCWTTFDAAAREAGRAGQLRGVHFAASDHAGRTIGKAIGDEVWAKALTFFKRAHDGGTPKVHAADCDRDDADDPTDTK